MEGCSFIKNKKDLSNPRNKPFYKCRRPESNRYGYHYPRDFKSRASASSATAAFIQHLIVINGTNRARTYDPLLVRQMLSQLSYDPKMFHLFTLFRDRLSHQIRKRLIKYSMSTTQKRLELSTSAVTGRRSNQLSHWAV